MLTGLLSLRAFCWPYKVMEQEHPWRVPIGQWGPGFAPTDYVAHWWVIGHCVGIMAAHGMSQARVFVTSHHTSSRPTPPCPVAHPNHPSIINNDSRKGWQKIPWISAIRDIIKVNRWISILLFNTQAQCKAEVKFLQLNISKW